MRANGIALPDASGERQSREGIISNIGDFGRHLYQEMQMMCGFTAPHGSYR
jgi:hypothetical protein